MSKKIFVALCLAISLCIPTQAMDRSDEQTYSKHQITPRVSLLKTALVTLGLMLSPQAAQPLSEFGGCYLMGGTYTPTNCLDITQIRTSGCATEAVEPLEPLGKITSISMYLKFSAGTPSIISSYLCSRNFNVNYHYIMDYGFNMSGNNCYYPDRPPISTGSYRTFLFTIDKSDENRNKDNIVFDNTFAKFMNSGICPSSNTIDINTCV
jgi:hypothetical protein